MGRITDLTPGPGRATTVTVVLDRDVRVPRDVRAAVSSKSAIGEGFIQLTPQTAGEPYLAAGDVIPLSRTDSQVKLERLLGNLDSLAASIPLDDLATVLRESETALDGLSPSFDQLLTGTTELSEATLANIDDTTALLRDARTVLGTQAAVGPQTRRWAAELAGFLESVDNLNGDFATLYDRTASASAEVIKLFDDLRPILPPLLDNLIVVTQVAADRVPQLRKALAIFPWILENQVNTTRACDDYDAKTGKPIASSCHYDKEGKPIYQLHLSQQLDKVAGNPYLPCRRGYEGTRQFTPSGVPVNGVGPLQSPTEAPNLRVHCAAPPNDPTTPNVRGAQNVTKPAYER